MTSHTTLRLDPANIPYKRIEDDKCECTCGAVYRSGRRCPMRAAYEAYVDGHVFKACMWHGSQAISKAEARKRLDEVKHEGLTWKTG